jgi:hypothetical protein
LCGRRDLVVIGLVDLPALCPEPGSGPNDGASSKQEHAFDRIG